MSSSQNRLAACQAKKRAYMPAGAVSERRQFDLSIQIGTEEDDVEVRLDDDGGFRNWLAILPSH